MSKRISLFIFIVFFNFVFAEDKEKTQSEKEQELVDFSSIKDLLKQDMLDEHAKRRDVQVKTVKKERTDYNKRLYQIPGEDEFWSIMSEYWLAKNATILKWDFQHPDYGIGQYFQTFLEQMGFYEEKFRLLPINSPDVFHMALPAGKETIFLVSIPFVRSMDLSKLEISVLLFSDLIRAKHGYFKQRVAVDAKLSGFIGSNFFDSKKLDQVKIKSVLEAYDQFIFEKGFTFKEQFKVTKKTSQYLKPKLKLWNEYYSTIQKIDSLIKTNLLYKKYSKIYPSPELQLGWLSPKESR